MKTNLFTHLIAVAFGLTAIANTGCSEKAKSSEASLPSMPAATNPASKAASGPIDATQVATPVSPEVASAQWTDIKDITFDLRAQFFAGLQRLEAKVDGQMAELTARRATMNSTVNTKDWDFAMKEMGNARAYLKSMREELSKATPETWNQEKDKAGQAWVRTQDAYAMVKSSTTT